MSDKQTPWWEATTEQRLWTLRIRQVGEFLVHGINGDEIVQAHDIDLLPTGALVLKRIVARKDKITAWQIVKVYAPGQWEGVEETTDWPGMVAMEDPNG